MLRLLFIFFILTTFISHTIIAQTTDKFEKNLSNYRTKYEDPTTQNSNELIEDKINIEVLGNQETIKFLNDYKKEYIEINIVKQIYSKDSILLVSAINQQLQMAKQQKFWKGFAIEIYKGTSRTEAKETIIEAKKYDRGLEPKIEFNAPYYHVKVGVFDEKYHAFPLFHSLKKELSTDHSITIVPIKVYN